MDMPTTMSNEHITTTNELTIETFPQSGVGPVGVRVCVYACTRTNQRADVYLKSEYKKSSKSLFAVVH